MTQTEKLSLNLIAPSDPVDLPALNANFQTLDGVYSPANPPYVVGSYTGTGSDVSREITVGFKPVFLVIFESSARSANPVPTSWCFSRAITSGNRVTMTDSGFRIDGSSGMTYPKVNESGTTYNYVAFR